MQDMWHGIRVLRKNLGFATAVILTSRRDGPFEVDPMMALRFE